MTPKEDCEKLMQEVLPFAKQMLSEHGEFYPFGGVLQSGDAVTHVGTTEEGNDHPKSQTLIKQLKTQFQGWASKREIIASTVVFDVRIQPPGQEEKVDAIQVNLDHVSGYSVEVLFPYERNEKTIAYLAPFAQKGEAEIFPNKE